MSNKTDQGLETQRAPFVRLSLSPQCYGVQAPHASLEVGRSCMKIFLLWSLRNFLLVDRTFQVSIRSTTRALMSAERWISWYINHDIHQWMEKQDKSAHIYLCTTASVIIAFASSSRCWFLIALVNCMLRTLVHARGFAPADENTTFITRSPIWKRYETQPLYQLYR